MTTDSTARSDSALGGDSSGALPSARAATASPLSPSVSGIAGIANAGRATLAKQRLSAYPVYERGSPALEVLANAGFDRTTSIRMMQALVSNGFFVAPQVPTNAMLLASIEAFGRSPTNPETVLRAIAKARKRWQAMGRSGTESVFSTKYCRDAQETRKASVAASRPLDLSDLDALLGPGISGIHQNSNAQGIEAPSGGETQSGSTVGESPVPAGDAPETSRGDPS